MDEEDPRAKKMRFVVGNSLLVGVLLSMATVFVGVILLFLNGTGYACSLSDLGCLLKSSGASSDYPTTILGTIQGLLELKPFAVIELGVIILIATPVVRVITSIGVFVVEGDRKFVVITIAVFLILLFSFFVVPFLPFFKA
jgi:uncharacterized membrane protein